MPIQPVSATSPPFETVELRRMLSIFLGQTVVNPVTGTDAVLGNFKFGVYAFFDYDGEPIYVGQTNEKLRTRIRRHLTNQRTDAVAMNVLDPFEVYEVEVWPLPEYEGRSTADRDAKAHLNWLELHVFQHLLTQSHFQAVLNEKDPFHVADNGYALPQSWRGRIVSDEVFQLRNHPDTRIARRAQTLSLLAKVISERQVQTGLRRTLLTQAKRLAWLAERRLEELALSPQPEIPLEGIDED